MRKREYNPTLNPAISHTMKLKIALFVGFLLVIGLCLLYLFGRSLWYPVYNKFQGKQTVASVIARIGETNRQTLKRAFANANVTYPPKNVTLIAIKDEKLLEIWAKDGRKPAKVMTYPILAASGHSGPKLREGDRQVPEGIYRIIGFNPNSSFHLSMKLNYPNEFDLKHATAEGRTEPGTNIFIHGKAASIGCLAMSDAVIEQLFTLVHDVGKDNVKVIISPSDARTSALTPPTDSAQWVSELYQNIHTAMSDFE